MLVVSDMLSSVTLVSLTLSTEGCLWKNVLVLHWRKRKQTCSIVNYNFLNMYENIHRLAWCLHGYQLKNVPLYREIMFKFNIYVYALSGFIRILNWKKTAKETSCFFTSLCTVWYIICVYVLHSVWVCWFSFLCMHTCSQVQKAIWRRAIGGHVAFPLGSYLSGSIL